MKNIFILMIVVLLNISCTTREITPFNPDAFLKESYETRRFLKRSLSAVPEGANLVTPMDDADVLDVNWPGDPLITNVTENQPWRNHSHYHFVIDISDTDLLEYKETDSYRMVASILLDFYFSKMVELDYKVISEPHTFISHPVQFASNTWFKEQCNIIITGSVYINVEYKNALVIADISEICEP